MQRAAVARGDVVEAPRAAEEEEEERTHIPPEVPPPQQEAEGLMQEVLKRYGSII